VFNHVLTFKGIIQTKILSNQSTKNKKLLLK
jgi:hypothetical protein